MAEDKPIPERPDTREEFGPFAAPAQKERFEDAKPGYDDSAPSAKEQREAKKRPEDMALPPRSSRKISTEPLARRALRRLTEED